MNDLGLALAWLSVQVTLVLAPAVTLHALASRRGPAAGAWVASTSLGLVVCLSANALVPRHGWPGEAPWKAIATAEPVRANRADPAVAESVSVPVSVGDDGPIPARPTTGRGWPLAGLRVTWDRFERGAAAPAARCRPWGTALAVGALACIGVGLLRLLLGLWVVRLCRRRGRTVDDPCLTALLDELRVAMGYPRLVELREVPDLGTPATAGWRRPVLLLPDGWRSWDENERRAVLAHELAHVIRGDYAAGLVARVALVLHAYHPLVLWMAGRLQLQQELAADALGARFAGGRSCYLVALSRLVLRQDGRSPCWPARAFLPRQGTLIRRIAMLRHDTRMVDETWSRPRRALAALCLFGVAGGVALLRGPARGEDINPAAGEVRVTLPAASTVGPDRDDAIPLYSIPDKVMGVVTFRPAATFRRAGMAKFAELIDAAVVRDFEADYAKAVGIDPGKPGLPRLKTADIEWVACGVTFVRSQLKHEGKPLHTISFSGMTVRTTRPFDWVKFLNAWRVDTIEVRDGGVVYHKFMLSLLGPAPCAVYCPDDRTLVFDDEVKIRALIHRDLKSVPAFLQNVDWERASRGLLAVAINNQDETLAKDYDLGRPDDAVGLSLLKGVDRWVFGVDDADAIVLHAAAACRDGDASEAVNRSIDSLLKLGRDAVEHPDPGAMAIEAHARCQRMARALLDHLRVVRADRSVNLRAEGFGTLADFAAVVEAESVAQAEEDAAMRAGRDGGGESKGPTR